VETKAEKTGMAKTKGRRGQERKGQEARREIKDKKNHKK